MKLQGLAPLIQVFDMPQAVAFYRAMLGFELADHSPEIDAAEGRYFHWCLLRHGTVELMLNTRYDAGQRPPERGPEDALGRDDFMLFIGCSDIDAAYRELLGKGLDVDPPQVAPYGMKQLNLRDPDGYRICLQAEAKP